MRFFQKMDVGSLTLTLVGGLFCIMGVLVIIGGLVSTFQVSSLSTAPSLNLSTLKATAPGEEVFVEGSISEKNPLQFRAFVAYNQELYDGKSCTREGNNPTGSKNRVDCTFFWITEERVTPPLWLDLPDGQVRVLNTDYEIVYPTNWQPSDQLIAQESIRYQGLEVGRPIFAKGVVGRDHEGLGLTAEFVAGTDRETYFANEQGDASSWFFLGGFLVFLGGIFLAVWFFMFR